MSKVKQDKIPVVVGKRVRLTKLSDDHFDGKHPNGIFEGYVKEGTEIVPPTVGEMYWLDNFHTSVVQKIIDKNTFKTTYSTYKIEYLDNRDLSIEDLKTIHKHWDD